MVIYNVHQRQGKGGRPALIINKKKYQVQNLTQSVIDIPWGVEVVWALLTPLHTQTDSTIQKIVCGAIYLKPGRPSQTHTLLNDHLTDVYNILSYKYPRGLHWILSGDLNRMSLNPILSLDPRFKQIVQDPTRLNPPAILDPIIMTLSKYYQKPACLPPLEADSGKSESDHLTVVAEPLSAINNKPARVKRQVCVRRTPESGLNQFREWISHHDWADLYQAESGDEKALILQNTLLRKIDQYMPEKTMTFSSDDQPFFTPELKTLDKRRKQEYRRHRRSFKWRALNRQFKDKLAAAKSSFYEKKIKDLKEGEPGQWYSKLKRLCSFDQEKSAEILCEEISGHSDQEQAEILADSFSGISNEYELIKEDELTIPEGGLGELPQFSLLQVLEHIMKLKTNKSTVSGDIPAFLLKKHAEHICVPLAHVLNICIRRGEYPRIWKHEIQTPVPKEYPPTKIEMLRNICNLKNFDKIAEMMIGKIMVSDMADKMDPSQFGNKKGLSIQHYLMNMLHKILMKLDNNQQGDTFAVLAAMIDWKQAFPRQDPTLGVQSFIDNGVRGTLVPILVNYFQDRVMSVKWHKTLSTPRNLSGGGPQGATIG